MNAYFRRLRGDSSLLPLVSRLGLIVLDEGGTLEIDSEDMESAFNLFRMPPVWKSFFAVAKKSPLLSVPRWRPRQMGLCGQAITTVPMGWVGAVDLTQLLSDAWCSTSQSFPRASEVSSAGSFPSHPPYNLVCVDGLDVVSSSNAPANGAHSFINHFRPACDRLKLPLHAGKRVITASFAPILGAELDVAHGIRPVLGVHNFVPLGSCSVVRACLATLCGPVFLRYSSSSRKCTVRFWKGTQKTRSFQGRPRSLSSSSPFSWSPWQVLTCALLFATLLVAATHLMQERGRRKFLPSCAK